MNEALHVTLRNAMKLMRAGDLVAATEEIQRRLGGAPGAAPADRANDAPPIDAEFVVIDVDSTVPEPPVAAPAPRHDAAGIARSADPHDGLADNLRADAGFVDGVFACTAGSRRYKLFVPAAHRGRSLPLVVMLHGCTQGPDDFARGTRMNVMAEAQGCFVLYPAQAQEANASRCWNWFQPAHQGRDGGEPAIIAGLVNELAATYGLDRERIYAAGMSAGGAMAVALGQTYPDVFAAVGVHSGIPYRAAHDTPSAFAAMRGRGTGKAPSMAPRHDATSAVPTIVFHGDRDATVNPGNGERIVADSVAATPAAPTGFAATAPSATTRQGTAGGRAYTCTVHTDRQANVVAEHWVVHGAGHAWSGGDALGSFTDPAGPDASREMLRFFLERRRRR